LEQEQQQQSAELILPASVMGNGSRQQEQEEQREGQDFTCVVQQQQLPSVSSSNGSNSTDSCHIAELAVAVPPADIKCEDVVASSSSDSGSSASNSTLVTQSGLCSCLSCSSIDFTTQASNISCGPEQHQEQQQQLAAELGVHASVVCDGSRQTEQEEQHEVQGLQGQDSTCVVKRQQPPSVSSSAGDGCSASAVCHTAKVAEAVQAAYIVLEGAVCGSINTSGIGCRGSRTTPDPPSLVSSRLSHSSIGSVTEASSSSCAAEQQQQQHLSAKLGVRATDVCGSRQTEHEEPSEAPSLQGQDVACEGQDVACVGKPLQAPSAVSSSNGSCSRAGCSAAAACYHSSSTH
jgi:hypothetical protein